MRAHPAQEWRFMKAIGILAVSWPIAVLWLCSGGMSSAQDTASPTVTAPAKNAAQASSAGAPALKLTLQAALGRARDYSLPLQAALTHSASARQDPWQAGAALLATVT